MDPGANDYPSGNVNSNVRNNSFRISPGNPLDNSMNISGPSSVGYANNSGHDKEGFLCLNRTQTDYVQNHQYIQSVHNDSSNNSHYCGNFNEFSQSGSRKHPLSGVVRTRRRKAGISEEERVCIVCSEPASGYNFDRLTCESCKAFFRRNALKPRDKIKACNRGGGCAIEGNQRKHCPSCRLEKCLAVGMKRELILPPEKLEQRAKPRRRKHHSPQDSSSSPQNLLTGPSSVGSSNTNAYPPYLPSPLTTSSHPQHGSSQTSYNSSFISGASRPLHLINPVKFSSYVNSTHCSDLSLTTDTFNSSGTLETKECNFPNSSIKIPVIGKSDELFMPPVNQDQNLNEKFLSLESSQQSDSVSKIHIICSYAYIQN
ncbi:receptor [Schistosoma haematobium]|uniref:Receptor n=1 Tax=Schistosoma haematobium TaxID=6185 RepID=A0A922LNR8_SCHHA|nr:receptor [Schistosoma haematobium]KAH9590380.1 receptor [Schistosoma haematobium]